MGAKNPKSSKDNNSSVSILAHIIKHVVGNKAKGRISKQVFQENKARQIFRKKTNICCPLIYTRFEIRPSAYYRHERCINDQIKAYFETIYLNITVDIGKAIMRNSSKHLLVQNQL